MPDPAPLARLRAVHPASADSAAAAPTLADERALRAGEMAGVLAVVAATVAELHRSGVVHGQIRADHVLLDGRRPVLHGVRSADPATPSRIAADIADLGRLASSQAARCPRLLDRTARLQLAHLGGLAASTPDALDAERLARELSRVRGARLPRVHVTARGLFAGRRCTATVHPRPANEAGGDPEPRRAGSTAARAGAAVTLVLGVLLVGAGWTRLQPARPRLARVPADPTSRSDGAPRCPPNTGGVARGASLPIDLDGDGCPESVSVSGTTVTVDGVRYTLGRPGDVVVFGTWRPGDVPSPAVLRPRTGAVFVFHGWPGPRHDLTAHPAAVVPGAVTLRVRSRRDRPDQLIAARRGRPPVVVMP